MGKYSKKCAQVFSKRRLFGLAVLVLCLCILSGTTLAYLIDSPDSIFHLFSPGQVSCRVDCNMVDTVPQEVTVQNTGTVDAYIRATVVVNWVDANGNISAHAPEEDDYLIEYSTATGWEKAADGFWYYTSPVAPEAATDVLIQQCMQLRSAAPAGYTLSVEVIASAIQATPDNVVKDSWNSGVSGVDDSTLIIKEVEQP